jgi:NAD(P)-dependent dehydrogenase (short-subunit alcohol dehydrogenase family)
MSVVLITGSSTGIGLAAALHLAEKGHKVYASMRNPSKSAISSMADKKQVSLETLTLDVNSDESVTKAVKQVIDKEGFIDVLINNAGVSAVGPMEELPFEAFRQDMETNYFGTVRCIKAVLPSMIARRKGAIINITSIAGKIFNNFHSSYCAAKAAVEALSECLALEVQPYGIKISVVEPGVIETPIFSKATWPVNSNYANMKRLSSFFAASLENHVSPKEVALVIEDIIEGRSIKFRNPAGPDAAPLIDWRASLQDEDWVASSGIDDENWITAMEQGMHLNVRPYMENPSLIRF